MAGRFSGPPLFFWTVGVQSFQARRKKGCKAEAGDYNNTGQRLRSRRSLFYRSSNRGGKPVRFSLQKLALALILLFVSMQSAFGQTYPYPARQGASPAICTDCPGTNASGQNNAGLKTWPYAAPLVSHVGRYLDSTSLTTNFQGPGIRSLRSRRVRIARTQRGTAPPRVYIHLGSAAIGVYSLDRFFTLSLPGGMVSIKEIISRTSRGGYTPEEVLRWDAYIHPEGSESGWTTAYSDGQDRMFDLDFDDRGYVYAATGKFGWGIVQDKGETSGVNLKLVKQILGEGAILEPRIIFTFKTDGKYYTVVSDDANGQGRQVWDVTNPAVPQASTIKLGESFALKSWAKDDANGRVAVINFHGKLEIYTYSSLANGLTPMVTFEAGPSKKFAAVTVDENGNFWTSETTTQVAANKLVKLERDGAGYSKRSFDVYGGAFSPDDQIFEANNTVEYGDKYLTVVGRNSSRHVDVKLFKIEGGEPHPVDIGEYFKKYYWTAPLDHAQPSECGISFGTYPVKWNNKTYLIHSTSGLGDVYELQAGDSVIGSLKAGIFGTANPHAKPTETGPFYADLLRFRSESSNPTVGYNVNWNFDNTESGADNEAAARTGQDVEHQFTGLNTVSKITQTRHVKVTAAVNSEMTDTVNVTLKVPTARIGVKGTNIALSTDGAAIDLVAGDEFTDASDGTVESHYAAWTIDGTNTNLEPGETISAGDVGVHAVTLAAKYGKYDASFNTVGSPYVDTVSAIAYTVRPFVVSFGTHTTAGNAVTFKGTARKTSLATVLLAANWTVEWSLENGTTDVVPPVSTSVAVGTIPDFPVADKSVIPSGSVLKLKVSVDLAGVIPEAANYISHEVTQTLITPDPKITKSGCVNAGESCTLTAGSVAGNSIADWTIVWTLKKGTATIGTFNGNPYKPVISDPGTYSVSLTASANIFSGNATLPAWEIEGPLCGNPPTADQMTIYASCTSGCATNTDITFRADPWQYIPDDCEEYTWNFGDGSAAVTTAEYLVKHKYSSKGTKTVTLKVRKGTTTSPTFTTTVKVGEDEPDPPPPTCTFPSNINFSYSGPNGCGVGTPCKVGQAVKFTGLRGSTGLQSCDTANWTFHDTSSTTKSPSRSYSAPGTFTVKLVVTNSVGSSQPVEKNITIAPADTGGSDCTAPNAGNISVSYRGRQSGCTATSTQVCTRGEIIDFRSELFPINNPQACDKFEWDFGDGTAKVTAQTTEHAYSTNGTAATYPVSFRWYNNLGSVPLSLSVRFSQAPVIPPPVLTFTYFPTTAAKGDTVSFSATSNMDTTTGWTWTFTDGSPADTSQAATVSRTSSITHTFTKSGPFTVKVMARNSTDTSTLPPQASVQNTITLADVVNFKYLLPAVGHAGPWKSDVQIYTSDAVSEQTPLRMTARYEGTDYNLVIGKSTYIYEDFLKASLGREGVGPVIITTQNAKVPPQIWTRTYNQTDNGTFGQFIPAIRIDSAGAGSSFGEGRYYLAGLRSDGRYRTNVGLVNPNPTAINAIVTTWDDEGLQLGTFTRTLNSFQLDQFNIGALPDAKINASRPFSVQIEVPPGQWLYAYASLIDGRSEDPVFLQAVRESELTPEDYRTIMVPGVGHFNTWRSDTTIYNPPGNKIPVDLAYFDQGGNLVAEAKAVPVGAGEFLQFDDLLKEGILGNLGDSFGLLRITVPPTVSATHFPMVFARTYSDDGVKTYGQGISGFAPARANVKPTKAGLIPGIRSDSSYRTDIGITNLTDQAAVATVRLLDPITGVEFSSQQFAMTKYQSVKWTDVNLAGRSQASVKIEVVGGNIWAYASVIDRFTLDPEYVQAMPLP